MTYENNVNIFKFDNVSIKIGNTNQFYIAYNNSDTWMQCINTVKKRKWFKAIRFNNMFIVIAPNAIAYSFSGKLWLEAKLNTKQSLDMIDIACTKNACVIINKDTNTILRSINGIDWEENELKMNYHYLCSVAGYQDTFIISTLSGQTIHVSNDNGKTWKETQVSPYPYMHRRVFSTKNGFVMFSYEIISIYRSIDGYNWKSERLTDIPAMSLIESIDIIDDKLYLITRSAKERKETMIL